MRGNKRNSHCLPATVYTSDSLWLQSYMWGTRSGAPGIGRSSLCSQEHMRRSTSGDESYCRTQLTPIGYSYPAARGLSAGSVNLRKQQLKKRSHKALKAQPSTFTASTGRAASLSKSKCFVSTCLFAHFWWDKVEALQYILFQILYIFYSIVFSHCQNKMFPRYWNEVIPLFWTEISEFLFQRKFWNFSFLLRYQMKTNFKVSEFPCNRVACPFKGLGALG